MKIQALDLQHYQIPFANDQLRHGVIVEITNELGQKGHGEIAPLPKWSRETLEESLQQLEEKRDLIFKIDWTARNCLEELAKLKLYPSVSFGLESALLSLLSPLPDFKVETSALLMGTFSEILAQAKLRRLDGYTSAKLKVSNLKFEEAFSLISQLKDFFRLRIDVNRAWDTEDSLRFFSQFPLDTFDYVEEPFKNPKDLKLFPHPLAVDESFPQELDFADLENLPTLKALIYKPTLQGGMLECLPLHEWTTKNEITLVLSSSFEADLGLAHVASITHRLGLSAPVGIGTYHHMKNHSFPSSIQFSRSFAHIIN